MKLRRLHLDNFRAFQATTVELDPQLTLVLGGNAAGKTALLDGIAVALGSLFQGIDESPSRHIRKEEARRSVFTINGVVDLHASWPVVVEATGSMRDPGDPAGPPLELTWRRTLEGPDRRTTRQGSKNLETVGQAYQEQVRAGQLISLPVIALYGTQRLWLRKKATEGVTGVGNRFDGYADCLDIAATERLLTDWMKQRTLIQVQQGRPHPQLAAVTLAISTCLNEVSRVWFDLAHDEIRFERGSNPLNVESFSMLSDGYRSVIAMVADLARRAAVLNPQHGEQACQLAEGVVLIDELDLHLHPAWQRRIVADLQRTFPRLQVIATTHSPQVLSSVRREQVRVLSGSSLRPFLEHVEGRDSNALLEDVFGVSARPAAVESELKQIFDLLDDERFAEARSKLDTVRTRLGEDDAAVARAQWVLDTEAPSETSMPQG
ncbi:MAG TPA: AAA family ATPase [Kofleriaceae bacterium]|nr:AAA family ATPase [Kofleriaceae bacterium]